MDVLRGAPKRAMIHKIQPMSLLVWVAAALCAATQVCHNGHPRMKPRVLNLTNGNWLGLTWVPEPGPKPSACHRLGSTPSGPSSGCFEAARDPMDMGMSPPGIVSIVDHQGAGPHGCGPRHGRNRNVSIDLCRNLCQSMRSKSNSIYNYLYIDTMDDAMAMYRIIWSYSHYSLKAVY